jgi:hypothetical protein
MQRGERGYSGSAVVPARLFVCFALSAIRLFRTLGVDYYAIEGSPKIVRQLRHRFADLAQEIRVGDFTCDEPFSSDFRFVIARGGDP